MKINASEYSASHSFDVTGVSYIGAPKPNTAMFVSKKVGQLILKLQGLQHCLVFAENGLEVPEDLQSAHCFVFSSNPQGEYAAFTERFSKEEDSIDQSTGYDVSENGAYISRSAQIGKNVIIEPGVVIGAGVVIGDNTRICAGAVIKHATIGEDCIINEKAVVGAKGFTMAKDVYGNYIRINSLGRVLVGNHVEIGVSDSISRGSGGTTILEDYVKIDSLTYVAHDVHLHKNVVLTSGVVVGGFVEAMEGAYIAINAVIRNRVTIGRNSFVGMGAIVTKSVPDGITVVGNPARPFEK